MKTVIEVSGEGLESLLGKRVLLLCANYFYVGTLVGVNEKCVKLQNPELVYETGAWTDKAFADAQALPADLYVQLNAIEAFMASSR